MGRLAKDELAVASGRKLCSSPVLMKVHRPASKGCITSVNLLESPSRIPILNTNSHDREITDVTFDHVRSPHVEFLWWFVYNLE